MRKIREKPAAGLVVRYDYLWKSDFLDKKIEGAKDRPCAVVVPMSIGSDGRLRVLVAAITHTKPHVSREAIEIPTRAKKAIGLDEHQSWIIVDEVNVVDWADAGFVPASAKHWSYGFLPKTLIGELISTIFKRAKDGTLFQVRRE